jgi:N-acetyl-1-D-myo-inositol-2-amino-2-deoxy-alpha-D-glucopyranoside deacetylase
VAPQVVVTYAADGGYGHPDHVRAHDITAAAVRRVPEVVRLYATVHGRAGLDAGLAELAGVAGLPFRLPEPDELPSVADFDVSVSLDVSGQRAARLAALAAHATQVALWEGPPVAYAMSNGVAQPLRDVEEFVLLAGEPVAPGTDDLFTGIA